MEFFAVLPALFAAAAAEAQLPLAPQFLGQAVPAVPYASAPVNFAYRAEMTAQTAPLEAVPSSGFVEKNGYSAPRAPVIAAPQAGLAYAAAPVMVKTGDKTAPIAPVASHSSQNQAQNEQGKFAYGYQNINSAKQEAGNAHEAEMTAQTAPLEALPSSGFVEKNGHGAPRAPVISAPQAGVTYAAAPVMAKAAPIAPIASHSSQYQAQDEQGNFAYGYQNINSAKQEAGNAYRGVTGSYSYADEAGVHTTHYVADNMGFHVSADNLPVAPVHNAALPVAPVHNAVLPVAPVHHAALPVAPVHVAEPVVDTPAVVEAKAAFFKVYNAEKSRVEKRSAQVARLPAVNYADYQPYSYSAPLAYNYNNYAAAPFTTPLAYAGVSPLNYAAATGAFPLREATLTSIKLNPGQATFYRLD